MKPELDSTNLSRFVIGSEPNEPLQTPKLVDPVCQEINLGTKDHFQPIKVYNGLYGQELPDWTKFFHVHKSAFAWTYVSLCGIPAEIVE